MSSLNKVQLLGRLGADPEIRRATNGDPIVNMRLATSEVWKDKNTGEKKERTEWHTVVIFNDRLAKIAEQYLKKGSLVFVEGKLGTRSWEDQSGQKRYATEIVLKQFSGELILMPQGGGGRQGATDPDAYGQTSTREEPRQARDLDDEIPF